MASMLLLLGTGCVTGGQMRAIQDGIHAGFATVTSGLVTGVAELALDLLLAPTVQP